MKEECRLKKRRFPPSTVCLPFPPRRPQPFRQPPHPRFVRLVVAQENVVLEVRAHSAFSPCQVRHHCGAAEDANSGGNTGAGLPLGSCAVV